MNKWEIAKEVYKEIVKAITDMEEKYEIDCRLPEFIEVDGERFYKKDLHIFSRNPEYNK